MTKFLHLITNKFIDGGINKCPRPFVMLTNGTRTPIIITRLMIALIIMANAIPDRTTMILMTSSQIAEKIVTSEKANQIIDKSLDPAIDLLNVWIVKQKDELTKTDKK